MDVARVEEDARFASDVTTVEEVAGVVSDGEAGVGAGVRANEGR